MTSKDYNEIITRHMTVDANIPPKNINHLTDILKRLQLKIDPQKVILVGGTNGKGTVCAVLQTLLLEAGKNVGLFTSPHLIKVNERIKFNGVDVPDNEFCSLFREAQRFDSESRLSWFEYLTFMAVLHFFSRPGDEIDFAIFEVGLGGTWDATNVIPHAISVIAKLGMDHENILGHSIVDIARNKFGIIGENNHVFHLKFPPEAEEVSLHHRRKATFIEAHQHSLEVDVSGEKPVFFIRTHRGVYKMPLPGPRAAENISLALTVFDHLIPHAEKYMHAITKTLWPGRMERVIFFGREIFLSGDHNPQGIESLLELLGYYRYARVRFVVGICHDKKQDEMLDRLLQLPNAVLYLTETPVKTLPLEQYDRRFLALARCAAADPIEVMKAALSDAAAADMIVVTGSLYLVGLYKSAMAGS
jgi:dihydrofolate synthase/folylpolyglutamate synthase